MVFPHSIYLALMRLIYLMHGRCVLELDVCCFIYCNMRQGFANSYIKDLYIYIRPHKPQQQQQLLLLIRN